MLLELLVYGLIGMSAAKSSTTVDTTSSSTVPWSYSDELRWPGVRCQLGGTRQSPIDIRRADVKLDYAMDVISDTPIKLDGYERVLMSGANNGRMMELKTEGDISMHPSATGGPLRSAYRLHKVHYHWLSEHSLDGRKFPMEIHMIHIRTDLNMLTNALAEEDGLAIFSIFCVVENRKDEELSEPEMLFETVPKLSRGARINGIIVNVTKMLSPSMHDYFVYRGSLTLPECNEAVIWIVFEKPISITDKQYRTFTSAVGERHNFRTMQYNPAQKVYKKPVSYIQMPEIVNVFQNFFSMVGELIVSTSRAIGKVLR